MQTLMSDTSKFNRAFIEGPAAPLPWFAAIMNRGAGPDQAPASDAAQVTPPTAETTVPNACLLLRHLATRLQKQRGWSFDTAWNSARLQNPIVNRLAYGEQPFKNRTGTVTMLEDLGPEVVSAVSELEPQAKASQQPHYAWSEIPLLGPNNHNAVYSFDLALRRALAASNGDFDNAWESVKQTDPLLFARFVIGSGSGLRISRPPAGEDYPVVVYQ
jgi:hypothetical protein